MRRYLSALRFGGNIEETAKEKEFNVKHVARVFAGFLFILVAYAFPLKKQ